MTGDDFRRSRPQDTRVNRTPRECACTTIGSPRSTFSASCIQYVSQLSGNRMRCPVQCAFTGLETSPGERIARCAHVGPFDWEWWAGMRDQPHMDGDGFSSDLWTNETMVSRLHIDNASTVSDDRPNFRSLSARSWGGQEESC
jgi:hypothetical protein